MSTDFKIQIIRHQRISAVKIINRLECERTPEVFYDGREAYYVVIDEKLSCRGKQDINELLEFASEVPSTLLSYIEEHSKRIDFGVLTQL